MRFTCDKCNALYSIADDKVRGKLVRFRCKRCQQVLLLRGDGAARAGGAAQPPAPEAASAGRPGAPVEWFAGLDGQEQGPIGLAELERRLRSGALTQEHFFWREGMQDWLPLEQVPELAHLAGTAGARPAGLPAPPPVPRDARRDERQRAVERERESALQLRREADRKAAEAERRAAEAERKAAEAERKAAEAEARRAQAAREAEQAEAEIGRVDTGKFSTLEGGAIAPAVRKVVPQASSVDESDAERKQLVERAIKRRAKARVGRHEERIADEFFSGGEEGLDDESLPPPPVAGDASELAQRLHQESIHEEYAILEGNDPEAQRRRQERDAEVARVAAAQAGVRSQKRRLAMALLSMGLVIAVLGGLLALAQVQGWFSAFGGLSLQDADGELLDLELAQAGNLSPEEARRLRERLLTSRKAGARRNGKRPGGAGKAGRDPGAEALADVLGQGKPALSESEAALAAFYGAQAGDKPESPTLRGVGGVDFSAAGLQLPGGLGGPADPLAPALAKPEVVPDAPGAAGGPRRLTELQIRLTVQRNRPQVKYCLERQLKKDSSVAGKLELTVRVRPDGRVEWVKVATEKFRNTFLEDCLVKKVQQWMFPTFDGEAYELSVPLLLTAQDTY
ncbi:MAG TPA: AgmX/PglI C-terminal domain-containing protein [Myxococcota bacterium]|nr:AgmX/PglI C-terminal domain-containing protein [Myxococcota bacterium]HRY91987.1 AgmX/PglI C-terminal domain-containing protein [Myxococcota bacterium]HSA21375.1 AgmX/PglI C-terminal domain-containing protein [Myxococcota bacterium]